MPAFRFEKFRIPSLTTLIESVVHRLPEQKPAFPASNLGAEENQQFESAQDMMEGSIQAGRTDVARAYEKQVTRYLPKLSDERLSSLLNEAREHGFKKLYILLLTEQLEREDTRMQRSTELFHDASGRKRK